MGIAWLTGKGRLRSLLLAPPARRTRLWQARLRAGRLAMTGGAGHYEESGKACAWGSEVISFSGSYRRLLRSFLPRNGGA